MNTYWVLVRQESLSLREVEAYDDEDAKDRAIDEIGLEKAFTNTSREVLYAIQTGADE